MFPGFVYHQKSSPLSPVVFQLWTLCQVIQQFEVLKASVQLSSGVAGQMIVYTAICGLRCGTYIA